MKRRRTPGAGGKRVRKSRRGAESPVRDLDADEAYLATLAGGATVSTLEEAARISGVSLDVNAPAGGAAYAQGINPELNDILGAVGGDHKTLRERQLVDTESTPAQLQEFMTLLGGLAATRGDGILSNEVITADPLNYTCWRAAEVDMPAEPSLVDVDPLCVLTDTQREAIVQSDAYMALEEVFYPARTSGVELVMDERRFASFTARGWFNDPDVAVMHPDPRYDTVFWVTQSTREPWGVYVLVEDGTRRIVYCVYVTMSHITEG